MMSRGISLPVSLWRKPVSMVCEASVRISTTSPRFAWEGTLTMARAMLDDLRAGGERDDHVHLLRPEGAVAHLRDRGDGLRVGEPDARRDQRPPRARSQMERRDVGLRVLLGEHVDRLDVVGLSHRAVDPD